jgi:hypothetical protein
VATNRSINTLPSTTSPTNTTRQTKSMPPSKTTRRRSPTAEPKTIPSRRRVRKFHNRSLCNIGTVVSNKTSPAPKLATRRRVPRCEHLSCREQSIERSSTMKATPSATAGHLARSKSSRSGIPGRHPTKRYAFRARRAARRGRNEGGCSLTGSRRRRAAHPRPGRPAGARGARKKLSDCFDRL